MIRWLWDNKEWLFSGIGIAIVAGIVRCVGALTGFRPDAPGKRRHHYRSGAPLLEHPLRNRVMISLARNPYTHRRAIADIARELREHPTKVGVLLRSLEDTEHVRYEDGKYHLTSKGDQFLVEHNLI